MNDDWTIAANFQNIFDKKYYSTVSGALNASDYYGDARNFLITLRGNF